jgi:hypothetical protein
MFSIVSLNPYHFNLSTGDQSMTDTEIETKTKTKTEIEKETNATAKVDHDAQGITSPEPKSKKTRGMLTDTNYRRIKQMLGEVNKASGFAPSINKVVNDVLNDTDFNVYRDRYLQALQLAVHAE